MARVELASLALGVITDEYLNPLPGRTVTIRNPDGSNATTYTAYSGGSSSSTGTLTSNSDGTLPGWVEGADYLISYTTPSGTVISRRLPAVSGSVETRVGAAEQRVQWASVTNPIGIYLGAAADGTDDTAVCQAWIDWVEANLNVTRIVFFPSGNYTVSGLTAESCTLLGEQSSRVVAGLANLSTDLGSRLIHKLGATTPLVTLGGGFSGALGWEQLVGLTLQGKQNQNVTAPKRPIVSASDRRHFTVSTSHVPPASAPTGADYPGYGICMFYDANGYRLGSGCVQSFNAGTGEITLFDGSDNYTGITGSGNLLTSTEKVAFAPSGTWDADGSTFTNYPDSTMISPPAVLIAGRTKALDNLYIKDFHVGVVMSDSICEIGRIWTNNCGLAGVAVRAIGSGADVSGRRWFLQAGGSPDMGQANPAIGRIDANGNWSLCGVWGLPSKTVVHEIICDEGYHAILDRAGLCISIGTLIADKPLKEAVMSWGGSWISGTADPTLHIDNLIVTTVGLSLTSPTTLNFPTHARSVVGVRGSIQRVIDIDCLNVARFDSASLSSDDFACVAKVYEAASSGRHEIFIRSIPCWTGADALDGGGVYPFQTTGVLVVPRLTSALRDALAGTPEGAVILNTSTGRLEVRKAATWHAPTSLALRGLTLQDDFEGDQLKDEWATWKGTDAESLLPAVTSGIGGTCLLQGGDDPAGTYAVNASRLDTVKQWQPVKGGLAVEARLAANTSNIAVFLGLTSTTGSAQIPFELSGTTLTSYPADAVGILFDSRAGTVQWCAVGVKNNVDATKQFLGAAPGGISAYQVLRVEVSPAGVATFYLDGVEVGTAMTNAVSDVAMTPVVAMFSSSAAIRQVLVDYIICEQNR